MDHQKIAWLACLTCMILSARFAIAFLRRNPNLFTCTALFSSIWVLLLPYYSDTSPSYDLLSGFGGFLSVYIGYLLIPENMKRHRENKGELFPLQLLGVILLGVIATPPTIDAFSLALPFTIKIEDFQSEMLISTVLSTIGFASIAYGFSCNKTSGRIYMFYFIVSSYVFLEVFYTIVHFSDGGMGIPFYYGFAAMKIIYTIYFGILVTNISEKNLSTPLDRFMKYICLK